MEIRRVTTGQREDGKSVFVDDEVLQPYKPSLLGGNEIFSLWATDGIPQLPTEGEENLADQHPRFFPKPNGVRFTVWTVPPRSEMAAPPEDMEAAVAECEEMVPGMTTEAVTDAEGSHATDTIDPTLLLAGEIDLTLDSGETKTLRKGDCIIQSGTSHAWVNNGTETCVMVTMFVGAERTG